MNPPIDEDNGEEIPPTTEPDEDETRRKIQHHQLRKMERIIQMEKMKKIIMKK